MTIWSTVIDYSGTIWSNMEHSCLDWECWPPCWPFCALHYHVLCLCFVCHVLLFVPLSPPLTWSPSSPVLLLCVPCCFRPTGGFLCLFLVDFSSVRNHVPLSLILFVDFWPIAVNLGLLCASPFGFIVLWITQPVPLSDYLDLFASLCSAGFDLDWPWVSFTACWFGLFLKWILIILHLVWDWISSCEPWQSIAAGEYSKLQDLLWSHPRNNWKLSYLTTKVWKNESAYIFQDTTDKRSGMQRTSGSDSSELGIWVSLATLSSQSCPELLESTVGGGRWKSLAWSCWAEGHGSVSLTHSTGSSHAGLCLCICGTTFLDFIT